MKDKKKVCVAIARRYQKADKKGRVPNNFYYLSENATAT
jgi:hypothetical protein